MADQCVASASNFAVGVVVARVSGPTGLGAFALAYTCWVLLTSIHRSLITDPMTILGDMRQEEKEVFIRRGFAAEIVLGFAASLLFVVVAATFLAIGQHTFGMGLLAVAPWIIFLDLQDYWRWIGFMQGLPRKALQNDLVFIVVQAVGFGIVALTGQRSVFVAVAAWGLGAAIASLYGLRQFSVRPSLLGGLAFLLSRLPTSRWLAGERAASWAATQLYLLLAGALLGVAALGGLKAAQALVLGPTIVVINAGGSFGLPEASRQLAEHGWRAMARVARFVAAAAVLSTGVWAIAIFAAGGTLLGSLYGPAFIPYVTSARIFAVSLLVSVFAIGPTLTLTATFRVRPLFILQIGEVGDIHRSGLCIDRCLWGAGCRDVVTTGRVLHSRRPFDNAVIGSSVSRGGAPGRVTCLDSAQRDTSGGTRRSVTPSASHAEQPATMNEAVNMEELDSTYPVRSVESPEQKRRQVLHICYCCAPSEGSEAGTGWAWAKAASKVAHVTLITPSTAWRRDIEEAIAANDLAITVCWVNPPARLSAMLRGKFLGSLHYCVWQAFASVAVRKLERRSVIDAVHHVSFGSDSLPSALLASRAPVRVWGPVGGATHTTIGLYRYLTPRGVAIEIARSVVNGMLRASSGKWLTRHATLILAMNDDVHDYFRTGPTPVVVESSVSLDRSEIGTMQVTKVSDDTSGYRTALFVGRLLPWKGLLLAIESLRYAPNWRLVVLGEGPDRKSAALLAERIGVAGRVEFRGLVARAEVLRALSTADGFLFPSFHDSASWAVAEAAAQGCPVICLDAGGPQLQAGHNARVVPIAPERSLFATDRRVFAGFGWSRCSGRTFARRSTSSIVGQVVLRFSHAVDL